MVREYVAGRRVTYLGPFAMLAILIVAESYLRSRLTFDIADTATEPIGRDLSRLVEQTRIHHEKWFFIGLVPVQATFSYLWFRAARQNFGEHFVLNLYGACTALIVSVVTWGVIAGLGEGVAVGGRIANAGAALTVAYYAALYCQYFSGFAYRRTSLVVRSVGAAASFDLCIILLAIA